MFGVMSYISTTAIYLKVTRSDWNFKNDWIVVAVYGSLLMIFALVLEISCFIIEAGGFTVPLFVKLFRRYSVLHFFSVSLIMISAGLWFAFSESLVQELSSYPRFRGSKVYTYKQALLRVLFRCLLIFPVLTGTWFRRLSLPCLELHSMSWEYMTTLLKRTRNVLFQKN